MKDADLKILLEKKLSLLKDWYNYAQRQITLLDMLQLDQLLIKKDQLLEAIIKTDESVEKWQANFKRPYHAGELTILQKIGDIIIEIKQAEELFDAKLNQDQHKVESELKQLNSSTQLKNYLSSDATVGKNLSFRR